MLLAGDVNDATLFGDKRGPDGLIIGDRIFRQALSRQALPARRLFTKGVRGYGEKGPEESASAFFYTVLVLKPNNGFWR